MLITQRVDNFSLTQSAVALQCPYTVSLDSNPAQVQQLLCSAAASVPKVLDEPAPQAFFSSFSQDGLVFTLHCWVADPQQGKLQVQSDVNAAVWTALCEAGVALPPAKPSLSAATSSL
jgi:small-conductance mechanosensitive channel